MAGPDLLPGARVSSGGENKTPPLDQQLLRPLLAAAF